MENRTEIPPALTQEGIASAVGIEEEQISTCLHDMLSQGSLKEKRTDIEGMKQRMLAYYLTSKGIKEVQRLKANLGSMRIPVQIGRVVKRMTLREINESTSIHLTLSDIVGVATEADIVSIRELEEIEKRRRKEMDQTMKKIEDYTRAMMAAWQDGKMTTTERLLMDQLRTHLHVAEEEHEKIESEVIGSLPGQPLWYLKIYEGVVKEGLKDGKISSEERAILKLLQKNMGISQKDANQIEKAVRKRK
jgi:hypothetical protein